MMATLIMSRLPLCLRDVPPAWAPVGPQWTALAGAHLGHTDAANVASRSAYTAALYRHLGAPMEAVLQDLQRRVLTELRPPTMRLSLDDDEDDAGPVVYRATLEPSPEAVDAGAAAADVPWAEWRVRVTGTARLVWSLERTPGANVSTLLLAHDARALLRVARVPDAADLYGADFYADMQRNHFQSLTHTQYDQIVELRVAAATDGQVRYRYETVEEPFDM